MTDDHRFDHDAKVIQPPDEAPDRTQRLEEALRKIAGGDFEGASGMAIRGDWKNMYRELQKIAVSAIDDV